MNSTQIKNLLFITTLIAISGYAILIHRERAELEKIITAQEKSIREQDSIISKAELKIFTLESLLASTTKTSQELESKIDSLSHNYTNSVNILNKMQARESIDDELLKKYSRTFFLNENYVPPFLLELEKSLSQNRTIKLIEPAKKNAEAMLEKARSENLKMEVISGYRSFREQSGLKNAYKVKYGAGTANAFSADQGYSEHQLGSALDITKEGYGLVTSFDQTKEFTWLSDHAYEYGYILSYPKNNPYYIYEPWHYRYVGKTLAKFLHDSSQTFNDLDERVLQAYKDFFNN